MKFDKWENRTKIIESNPAYEEMIISLENNTNLSGNYLI